jgi:hypothetical protein
MEQNSDCKRRKAVTSTVGIVLLVAIAVILAAIIGAAALNFLQDDGSTPPPVVGVTVEEKIVDIGGENDRALCPGDEETLFFCAEWEVQRTVAREVEVGW